LKENRNVKPYTYEKIADTPDSLVILTETSGYALFYEKELETFLDSTLSLVTREGVEKYKVEIRRPCQVEEGTSDKTSDKRPTEPKPSLTDETKPIPLVFAEKTSENKPDDSNAGLIPCPFCASQVRQMFFASDRDLKTHCEVFHGES
jgi:hypothetical protein